jgi:hypothetical protein
MRAWVPLAAALSALALATPAQAASGCHPAGSHRQARDALVRVFSVKSGLFACRNGGRRVTLLERGQGWRPYYGVHARGANVAFGRENCDEFSCYANLRVMHVGRRRASEVVEAFPAAENDDSVQIENFVLGSAAALAWVECQEVTDGECTVASQRVADDGPVILGTGKHIDLFSLRIDGGTVSWTDAGQPRSAPLQ